MSLQISLKVHIYTTLALETYLTYDEYDSDIQESFPVGFCYGVIHKGHKLFGNNWLLVDWRSRLLLFLLFLLFSSQLYRFSLYDSGQVFYAFSKFIVFGITLGLFHYVGDEKKKKRSQH